MARILISWELGGHLGHLGRLVPIAEALRSAGHQILFAVCDLRSAAQVLAPRAFEYVQAPLFPRKAYSRQPPASYAELLLAEGFGDGAALSGVLGAWRRLFELYRPAAVLADHSPSVLVSVRHDAVPVVPIGNGFQIPPDASPMPSIRVWEQIDSERLMRSEQQVLRVINRHVGPGRKLGRLADLFHEQRAVITTFPELDHYRERISGQYCGPLFSNVGSGACPWPGNARRRVFGYVHNGLPGLRNLLGALSALEADVILVVTGLSAAARRKYSTANLRLLSEPVELGSALAGVDVAITQGGSSVSGILLAGVPTLLVPGTVEQLLLCRRVEELGAGICISNERSAAVFGEALRRLQNVSHHRDKARAFADKYSAFSTDAAVADTVALIERRLASQPLH